MNDTARQTTIGLDVGDRHSVFCVLDARCKVLEEGRVATTPKAILKEFKKRERATVALEAGTHSAWITDVLEELGHEVLVANPRKLELITKSDRKNDRNDAKLLARLARVDPSLLSPIKHRAKDLRAHLAVVRTRSALVQTRTKLINTVRGLTKAAGERIKKCDAGTFPRRAREEVSDALRPVVAHVLKLIDETTEAINAHDVMIEELATKTYPVTSLLTPVPGIGTLTALAFVLTLGDPHRFKKSRTVGAYFGLVPRQQQSAKSDPQLRITKAGDALVRRLLVGSAHCVLKQSNKTESDLRTWGLGIAARGGKNAKKRAVVAVARKIAVVLHRLWVTGEAYEAVRSTGSKRSDNESAPPKKSTEGRPPSQPKRRSSDSPCGEVRGRPTRVENAQKRPRKGGRVSHPLPDHRPLHTAKKRGTTALRASAPACGSKD
jgi:transposase